MKELPKMYHTKIHQSVNNNERVYSTLTPSNDGNIIHEKKYSSQSIEKKIQDIFHSLDYVYKADVTIVTDSDVVKKRIVARNANNLITIDNEYIPISIIRDIYK